ncbi:hypothetical protein GMSM_26430 [Geomonas sp. Red276]
MSRRIVFAILALPLLACPGLSAADTEIAWPFRSEAAAPRVPAAHVVAVGRGSSLSSDPETRRREACTVALVAAVEGVGRRLRGMAFSGSTVISDGMMATDRVRMTSSAKFPSGLTVERESLVVDGMDREDRMVLRVPGDVPGEDGPEIRTRLGVMDGQGGAVLDLGMLPKSCRVVEVEEVSYSREENICTVAVGYHAPLAR